MGRGGAAAGGGDARAAAWPEEANHRKLDPRGADHAAGGVGHGVLDRQAVIGAGACDEVRSRHAGGSVDPVGEGQLLRGRTVARSPSSPG
ncbi:hypothetical protein G6F65_022447 [Rhizopus arrhizus]|nr:hypothetical protein G6F65_022447 [Rhizopus arrhizus]